MATTIAEVRSKYPEYNDLSDEQLGQLLHKKYYSDIPYDDFAQKAGIAAKQSPMTHEAPKPNPAKGLFQNIGAEALGGFSDLDQMLRTPLPLGQAIQGVMGIEGPPLQGDPEFHNSGFGRGIRYAAPSAIPLGATTNAGRALTGLYGATGGFLAGVADKAAEDSGASGLERLGANVAPIIGLMGVTSGVKGVLRGSAAKGREMAANADELERLGITDYSVSQISPEGNFRLPFLEKTLSFAYGGQGEFRKLGVKQTEQLIEATRKVAGGSLDQADQTGRVIWNGLFRDKDGWVSRSRQAEETLWKPIDEALQRATVQTGDSVGMAYEKVGVRPTNYERALKEILGQFDSPNQAQAVGADKVAAASYLEALAKDGGVMTFSDFKQLRREIGEANSGSRLIPGERSISDKQAGKLWAALMDDYRELAAKYGVEKEFAAAHSFTKEYHNTSRTFFKTLFGKDAEPTKVIDEFVQGNYQQPEKWAKLRQAVDPEEFAQIQQYVVNRLGIPSGSSVANFSLETFHTNYKNAFGASAKSGNYVADAVLGKRGTGVRDGMEALFKIADKTKQGSALLFNTSGSAGSGIAGASMQAILTGLMKSIPQIAGGGIGAAAGGPLGLAGGIAAGAGAVNVLSRLMTNPRFGRWLANNAFQSPARLPGAITVLAKTDLGSDEAEEAKQMFIDKYNELFGPNLTSQDFARKRGEM